MPVKAEPGMMGWHYHWPCFQRAQDNVRCKKCAGHEQQWPICFQDVRLHVSYVTN